MSQTQKSTVPPKSDSVHADDGRPSEAHAVVIQEFIARLGGIERAKLAIEALEDLQEAA